ncbi:MAG: peptidylprolyl isomerase, partial [Pseudomonadota bacterium]
RIRGLTREGFYDGVIFHRVIPGFMAQTGDPSGTGTGGSPLPDLEAEFSKTPHLRGTVSAARTQDPNSANSQFFITFMPNPGLDGEYTALGRVKSGMQFVDAIAVGEPPAEPSHVVRATIGNDVPPMSREELLAFVAPAQRASAAALSAQLPPGIEPDIVLPPPGTPADAAGAATAGEGQTAPAPAIAADSDTPADAPTR